MSQTLRKKVDEQKLAVRFARWYVNGSNFHDMDTHLEGNVLSSPYK